MTSQEALARLARNLRRLREERRLSIAQLAERTGLEPKLLEAVESGETIDSAKLGVDEMEMLANGLGVEEAELLRRES